MTPTTTLRALAGDGASPVPADRELTDIVHAAVAGDAAALRALVDRFERALRSITRFYRLSEWDADDVIQATWLAFLEHGRTLREPAAVSGWLMTTARRQSLRLLQGRMREQPSDDPMLGESAEGGDPYQELLAAERRSALLGALEGLPLPKRRLMTLLVAKPGISYEDVGQTLGMPIGSIGPTRLRSMSSLRHSARLQALRSEA